jgi:hypothetical protein
MGSVHLQGHKSIIHFLVAECVQSGQSGVFYDTQRLNDLHIPQTVKNPVLIIPTSVRIALLS